MGNLNIEMVKITVGSEKFQTQKTRNEDVKRERLNNKRNNLDKTLNNLNFNELKRLKSPSVTLWRFGIIRSEIIHEAKIA